jgi:hypothetical protein
LLHFFLSLSKTRERDGDGIIIIIIIIIFCCFDDDDDEQKEDEYFHLRLKKVVFWEGEDNNETIFQAR